MNAFFRQRLPAWAAGALAALLTVFFHLRAPYPLVAGEPGGTADATQWAELLQRMPFPYVIPLPEPRRSDLDGTYAKVVASTAERVHCLRCPDYAPESGVWKLNLDRGVFRIFHLESGWRSIATAIVADDRLLLANDPTCIGEIGLYKWRVEEEQLVFEAIDDPCAIQLRAANLTRQPWRSCRPPNIEAAVTDHWPKPEGCD